MAASDEFPRGLWLQSEVTTGTASVTFPAVAGLLWVLAQISAQLLSTDTTSAHVYNVAVVPPVAPVGYLEVDAVTSATLNQNVSEWSWQGKVLTPISTALVIAFNSPCATAVTQALNAYAYPV